MFIRYSSKKLDRISRQFDRYCGTAQGPEVGYCVGAFLEARKAVEMFSWDEQGRKLVALPCPPCQLHDHPQLCMSCKKKLADVRFVSNFRSAYFTWFNSTLIWLLIFTNVPNLPKQYFAVAIIGISHSNYMYQNNDNYPS